MKTYQFTREAKYIEYGVVTANSKEEAIELIKNNDYDDIYEELKVQSKDHLIHQPPVKK